MQQILKILKSFVFSFKFVFLTIYILIGIGTYIAVMLFPYTDEMIKECVRKAYAADPYGSWVGFGCYFNPNTRFFLLANMPGIIIFESIFNRPLFSDFIQNLPIIIQDIWGELITIIEFAISLGIFILIGHILDLIVHKFKKFHNR